MDGGGFEPPKQFAADLQSVPFGHSGIHPYGINFHRARRIPCEGWEDYYHSATNRRSGAEKLRLVTFFQK